MRRPARRLTTPGRVALILTGVLLAACSGGGGGDDGTVDEYGGFRSISADGTGRFRTARIDGVWWFVDPDGQGFFSTGVNNVNPAGDFSFALGRSEYLDSILAEYGSEAAWAEATAERLRSWGLNTIGGFSLPTLFADEMPYTVLLSFSELAPTIPGTGNPGVPVRDYLGPWFEVAAQSLAIEEATRCANDPWCIGVFTDNEPSWARTPRQPVSVLYAYASLPAGASAKVELQRFLERRYDGDVDGFNEVWGTQLATFDDFQGLSGLPGDPNSETAEQERDDHAVRNLAAERYFEVTHDALRAVSEDLLILGPRFAASTTPPDIYEVAAPYLDVVSINNYETAPANPGREFDSDVTLFTQNPWDDLEEVERVTRKPILISEFSYRAQVPDGPQNNVPSGMPRLPDQDARAGRYRAYIRELYSRPYVIGAHWFQYMDQPASGRGDGENSNFGLVDINDAPWSELVAAVEAESRALPGARLPSG